MCLPACRTVCTRRLPSRHSGGPALGPACARALACASASAPNIPALSALSLHTLLAVATVACLWPMWRARAHAPSHARPAGLARDQPPRPRARGRVCQRHRGSRSTLNARQRAGGPGVDRSMESKAGGVGASAQQRARVRQSGRERRRHVHHRGVAKWQDGRPGVGQDQEYVDQEHENCRARGSWQAGPEGARAWRDTHLVVCVLSQAYICIRACALSGERSAVLSSRM